MIIVKVMGGLGNQLQQYALYDKIKTVHPDLEVRLDLSWFKSDVQKKMAAPRQLELTRFSGLYLESCTNAERDRFMGGGKVLRAFRDFFSIAPVFNESEMYHPEIFDLTDGYIVGYFACEKYYADRLPELAKKLVFPAASVQETAIKNMDLENEMEERSSVSIHVRRGDYLDKNNADLFSGIATDAYYERAIAICIARDPRSHFYVFSDDPDYVREKYPNRDRFTVVDVNRGRDNMLDMRLMSRCHANICANSTFSFWGARLNTHEDKLMIRPLSMRNNQEAKPEVMHELWKDWVLIDRDGSVV